MATIQATKIKSIPYDSIKDGSDDKRKIPPGMFKPHMTFMISGKTGSGKSTALKAWWHTKQLFLLLSSKRSERISNGCWRSKILRMRRLWWRS